jgi:hypothetical protein
LNRRRKTYNQLIHFVKTGRLKTCLFFIHEKSCGYL